MRQFVIHRYVRIVDNQKEQIRTCLINGEVWLLRLFRLTCASFHRLWKLWCIFLSVQLQFAWNPTMPRGPICSQSDVSCWANSVSSCAASPHGKGFIPLDGPTSVKSYHVTDWIQIRLAINNRTHNTTLRKERCVVKCGTISSYEQGGLTVA